MASIYDNIDTNGEIIDDQNEGNNQNEGEFNEINTLLNNKINDIQNNLNKYDYLNVDAINEDVYEIIISLKKDLIEYIKNNEEKIFLHLQNKKWKYSLTYKKFYKDCKFDMKEGDGYGKDLKTVRKDFNKSRGKIFRLFNVCKIGVNRDEQQNILNIINSNNDMIYTHYKLYLLIEDSTIKLNLYVFKKMK